MAEKDENTTFLEAFPSVDEPPWRTGSYSHGFVDMEQLSAGTVRERQ
jgi:hypothetical protein